jgi:hypothetical protein
MLELDDNNAVIGRESPLLKKYAIEPRTRDAMQLTMPNCMIVLLTLPHSSRDQRSTNAERKRIHDADTIQPPAKPEIQRFLSLD